MIRELLSNNDIISSNRSIAIITFIFMLLVMLFSLFTQIESDILKTVLDYSLYIFVTTVSLKSVEKVTTGLKSKIEKND